MEDTNRRYLWQMGGIGAALLLAVLAFNLLVDPYLVFGTPRWQGINGIKHGFLRNPRIAKAYSVTRYKPHTVILGTSRTESAIDPGHPFFGGQPAYNLAFSGGSVYEMYRYLQHVSAIGSVRRVVVSVDFFQFKQETQWLSPDFSEDRLAIDREGRLAPFPWGDVLSLAMSGSALKESWWSIRHQKRGGRADYRDNGYREDSSDIPEILRKHNGQREEFINSERGYAKVYGTLVNPVESSKTVAYNPYDDVERILAWTRAKNMEVLFVIPPVHARHLEVIYQLGLWSKFDDWRRRLVQLIAADSSAGCRLWDFSGYNAITAEDVPPLGSKTPMKWWRESSHATSATGNLMMDAIQGRAVGEVGGSFGTCLYSANVEEALARTRQERDAWRSRHPGEVAEIAAVLR